MKRTIYRLVVAILGFVMVLAPCLVLAQTRVKIGNILPLSGPSASVGLQNKQAQDMAVEEINSAGGIKSLGGAKIQMLYADSESKPEKGVAEAERFINTEKVNILDSQEFRSGPSYPANLKPPAFQMVRSKPVDDFVGDAELLRKQIDREIEEQRSEEKSQAIAELRPEK